MNNPYHAHWEKAQEQSLKLAQYYTPECLVDLCLELLKPTGELFDPCCGLGGFLLKAKTKWPEIKISGNDIAKDLGDLPFEFTNSDYLKSEESKQSDYIIANIPFNSKKTHCQLVDENYCWIEKIIANSRKKTLIILPDSVCWAGNKKLVAKRKQIIESGVLELVIKLPAGLFNKTNIAPIIWLIDKNKTSKDIRFLNATRFSSKERKQTILTTENIQQICNQDDYLLMVNIFDKNAFPKEPELSQEEKKQQIQGLAKEVRENYEKILSAWVEIKKMLDNLEKDPEFYSIKVIINNEKK